MTWTGTKLPRCQATRKDGQPCTKSAVYTVGGLKLCQLHNPKLKERIGSIMRAAAQKRTPEQRKASARKAWMTRSTESRRESALRAARTRATKRAGDKNDPYARFDAKQESRWKSRKNSYRKPKAWKGQPLTKPHREKSPAANDLQAAIDIMITERVDQAMDKAFNQLLDRIQHAMSEIPRRI